MATAYLEHVNITVSDPDRTAKMLADLFGWRERWRGAAKDNGLSIHVGGDDFYVVVYANLAPRTMRFGVSEGMIMAAGASDDAVTVLELDPRSLPGDKIS